MFTATATKDQRPTPTPAPSPAPDERRGNAWVGKSVIFKGELISSEDMTIDGKVDGAIAVHDHALTIGQTAEIRADIAAKTVTVRGSVTGTITATHLVDVRETGSIEGNIVSPRVRMVEGSVLRGKIDTLTPQGSAKSPQP